MTENISFFKDEALESNLLRLSKHLGFDCFSDFAEEIRSQLKYEYYDVAGAFPLELKRINVYHAQVTSNLRIRALMLIDRIQGRTQSELLTIALLHSKAVYSPHYKALFRNGADYPYSFIRPNTTPVCPHCLVESVYIRHYWQLVPYKACHIHECELVHVCNKCQQMLNYQLSENIEYCQCGQKLADISSNDATKSALMVSRWLVGESCFGMGLLAEPLDLSIRYGVLLWYVNRYGDEDNFQFDDFIRYSEAWPNSLYEDLDKLVASGEQRRIRRWNRTFFHEVFNSLLKDCRHLPSRQLKANPVLQAVLQYLTQLVAKSPRDKCGNVADILLSILDVSTLLSCTTEEVYRLYDHGLLTSSVQNSLHSKLPSHQSVFHLRSVIELKLSRMCSSADGSTIYLSDW
ncbi:TniQ family protein [Photobacterium profundum]|uniref:TniQ family protein n=1 Tax=Photobacterium profundum TaxID=74109 RepID=UPI003D14C874